MYEHARKYNLTGTDAMVFEALCSLCRKTGEWKGSFATLARYSCCGNRNTAFYAVERLISKGLVFKIGTGVFKIRTETFNIATNSKEERTKEENINNNKSLPAIYKPSDDGWLAGFNLFWEKFNPSPEFNRRKNACKQIWQTLPESWRKLATDRAGSHSSERNPLFYLRDEDFLKEGGPDSSPAEKTSPTWLQGTAIDEAMRDGIPLVVCRNPETGKFGTVTKEDAEKFNLNILREM